MVKHLDFASPRYINNFDGFKLAEADQGPLNPLRDTIVYFTVKTMKCS